jgi:cysteine sulfinate desulfinase/cysteine desulfurase-like protein/glyoxylase-like metal-dependent hydrolase (beta-lactamase superfamily II)/rhodanese-related sulfurtransferase
MDLYLDANATTPVLPEARAAALRAMAEDFGNPSSVHTTGLKARALMDRVRASARRVLGAPTGDLIFVSGATEGIQTAVLSALAALRARRDAPGAMPDLLLYGATEHKAVPEALQHWNVLLGLNLELRAIPVGRDGRHDLPWLRAHAARAGLVCTMAANNETGVVSDLDGIAEALAGSPALWLVDGVQALGKLPLRLAERRIDYAPFSGHKLYAPKGIGLLYVREGAPFTPLMMGGGQEGALRSGTENMAGIAALGAVLAALESGDVLASADELQRHRERLSAALTQAFPGLVFNAPAALCLPTTLNFAVPGLSAKLLLDLFDAAGVRVSAGSACGASKAKPSFVLQAMGLPDWQCESAVRLSFGPAADAAFIERACAALRSCGEALRASCLAPDSADATLPPARLNRFVVAGACCYVLSDPASRSSVVIDPLPELSTQLQRWLGCHGHRVLAVLDTHSHGDHESSAPALRQALCRPVDRERPVDKLGWPQDVDALLLGPLRVCRLAVPGHTDDATAYLVHEEGHLVAAFVGDTVMPGALGRSDFPVSAPEAFADSLNRLLRAVGPRGLLLPGHDYDARLATTLACEREAQPLLGALWSEGLSAEAFAARKAALEQGLGMTEYQTVACGARIAATDEDTCVTLDAEQAAALLTRSAGTRVLDIREPYEQQVGPMPELVGTGVLETVPQSALLDALPRWLASAEPLLLICRSGNRSTQVARALRRLGRAQAWSLAGGMALAVPLLARPIAEDAALSI